MPLNQMILPEFDHEMANTRRSLERVPEDKFAWKPHEKSPNMGWLAGHIAVLPSWTRPALEQASIDIAPPGAQQNRSPEPKTSAELLAAFDKNVAEARALIASATDEQMMLPWTLLSGGQKVFTQPRFAVLRGFVLNHMIHHRAQLGVYLRLNNVPVPAIYGPSADESGM